jgi:hypothetical protein
MRAIIRMLNALGGFDSATAKIEAAWADFIGMMRFVPSPEYLQCYTDKLLEEIVGEVKGVSDTLGINVVSSTEMSPTVSLLNCAWQQFWDSPAAFPAWEMTKVAALQGAFSKR